MDNYIANFRVKYNHPNLRNPQQSQNKHAPIIYVSKFQYAAKDDDKSPLDADGILCVQSIVRALLFYGRAADNKLLVALRKLGQQQWAATQANNNAILQPLNYVATYPRDGITFQANEMILYAHSDTA